MECDGQRVHCASARVDARCADVDSRFRACRLEIHHVPWTLQRAEATIERNTMAEAAGIRLQAMAPLLHFSARQDMVA